MMTRAVRIGVSSRWPSLVFLLLLLLIRNASPFTTEITHGAVASSRNERRSQRCLRRKGMVVMLAAKKSGPKRTLVADNRPARRDYEIVEDLEVGVSLLGTEVKACREGSMNIQDGFAQIRDGECFLKGVHIGPCPNAGAYFQHEAKRERRLLLKKREIRKFAQTMKTKRLTLVPLKAYFNDDNRIKILLGLARGKNTQDKRDDVKDRESKRDIQRAMKNLR